MKSYEAEIRGGLKTLASLVEEGTSKLDSEAFMQVLGEVNDLQNALREQCQELMRPEAQALIAKLKSGKALSKDDIGVLRRWIVGDAEHYVKLENNFNDWVEEVKRLNKVIASYQKPSLDET